MSSNITGGARADKPKGSRTPIRKGEMYTREQAVYRLGGGKNCMKGLPSCGPGSKKMYLGDDLIKFFCKSKRS